MLGVLKSWIGRLALIATGVIFIMAGGLKALDPGRFTEQVAGYEFLPAALAPVVTYLLIPLEVALGVALIVDYRRRWALAGAVVLLVGFLGLMAHTWATGGNVSECGCFGSFVQRTPAETVIEDLVFIAIALLGLLAPGREKEGGSIRAGTVAVSGALILAFLPLAPRLPLDDIVTGLKPGLTFEELHLSLPDAAFSEGRHLVALLALEEEPSGEAADALSILAATPGAPQVAVIYADEEEVKDSFFWMHAPAYPMYKVLQEEMRALYRTLPRYFLVEDGVVSDIWDSLPPAETLSASVGI
jgi:uncharacterized membrane protein YphA (DoxX/SURF4 family)